MPLLVVACTIVGCGGADDTAAVPPSPTSSTSPDATTASSTPTASTAPPAPAEPLAVREPLAPDDGAWAQPYGVDVAADGTTWVLDTGNQRLLAFDVDGAQVAEVGGQGSEPGQFDTLGFGALAVGPDGEVFVVDNGNGRIQVFGPDGAFLREWGTTGDGQGEFRRAIGIAVDDAGQVYVTDDERPEVQVFDTRGTFVRTFGEAGDGPGGLVHATGIDVDADGNVWVADFEEKRIQVFDPAGQVVAEHRIPGPIGTTGTPEGIVVLDDGRVWVTSYRGGEVLQVPDSSSRTTDEPSASPSGDPDPWLLVAGGEGTGDGTFQAPVDLAVGPDDVLVVTDQQDNSVQRFGPVAVPAG